MHSQVVPTSASISNEEPMESSAVSLNSQRPATAAVSFSLSASTANDLMTENSPQASLPDAPPTSFGTFPQPPVQAFTQSPEQAFTHSIIQTPTQSPIQASTQAPAQAADRNGTSQTTTPAVSASRPLGPNQNFGGVDTNYGNTPLSVNPSRTHHNSQPLRLHSPPNQP